MNEKVSDLKKSYEEDGLELMASVGDWDMVTWCDQGIPVRHEFFISYMGEEPMIEPLKDLEQRVNRSQLLGNGYEIKVIEEPQLMCKVKVAPGWHFTSNAHCEATLKKFVSLI